MDCGGDNSWVVDVMVVMVGVDAVVKVCGNIGCCGSSGGDCGGICCGCDDGDRGGASDGAVLVVV